jgi:hypothetical protein
MLSLSHSYSVYNNTVCEPNCGIYRYTDTYNLTYIHITLEAVTEHQPKPCMHPYILASASAWMYAHFHDTFNVVTGAGPYPALAAVTRIGL